MNFRYRPGPWWCGACRSPVANAPEDRHCRKCGHAKHERHARVHSAERAVVYVNPRTGEHRTPARADQPMPGIYARQGFERHEILDMSAYEKSQGVVHEASNFNPGNEPLPEAHGAAPQLDPAAKEALIRDVAEAFASGPFTGGDKLVGAEGGSE